MVIRMLTEIGSIDNVDDFVDGEGGKAAASRASATASTRTTTRGPRSSSRPPYEVFAVTGKNPLLDIALKLEEAALADEYFISRKLYPNVDFYSGLIYQAMGFPIDMFPVLFAIPRTSGWLAHWVELLEQDSTIARPRQLYDGAAATRLRRLRRPQLTVRSRPAGTTPERETARLSASPPVEYA